MNISKQKFILGSILIIVIAMVGFFVFSGNGNEKNNSRIKYKEVEVKIGDFQVTVSADGVVKPIDRIEIKSKVQISCHSPLNIYHKLDNEYIKQSSILRTGI